MASRSIRNYQKHVYWLTRAAFSRLQEAFHSRNMKIRLAKGIVCSPLDEINKITCVAPEVWNETCARQGSWYRTSDKNGLYLVVSSFDIAGFDGMKTATISRSNFKPPRLASAEEKERLVRDFAFKKWVPAQWNEVGDIERRVYLKWAHRLGSDVKDFDSLLLSHSANHANFITPRFFIEDNHHIVPYSIDSSAHLCSCCLELFQVIGDNFRKKLVAPCPGAIFFARLEVDQYLLVEKMEEKT
ncbi:MAG: hypothetical protein JRJ85_27530 [Deltaproteobacteria bacterium]|nr:hypothetical protein [Deltaproteobacteria bacterium]